MLGQRQHTVHYVEESDRVLLDDTHSAVTAPEPAAAGIARLRAGGPAKQNLFRPSKTRAGIVTCGGLCPGLNDVIRGLDHGVCRRYGVQSVHGFCNGYEGFIARYRRAVLDLTPEVVSDINEHGGTILGSSRGEQDPAAVVDCLDAWASTCSS